MANTRTDAVAVARSQRGVKESPPQSNNVLYARWYGMNRAPWCAMFLSWVLAQVGNRSGYRFASTASSVAWARRAGKLRPVSDARPGDIVVRLYTATTGHTGMVVANEGATLLTVEGNTSPTNSRDGGEVMDRRRSSSWWHYCIGIDYGDAAPPAQRPEPDPPQVPVDPISTSHFAEEAPMDKHWVEVSTDGKGDGWRDVPGVHAGRIVSLVVNSPSDPPAGGYGNTALVSRHAMRGGTRLVVRGGQANHKVGVDVWSLAGST